MYSNSTLINLLFVSYKHFTDTISESWNSSIGKMSLFSWLILLQIIATHVPVKINTPNSHITVKSIGINRHSFFVVDK